ncbi:MAG: hypothetical protein HYX55_01965, partial [Chloroflexi bacterium]|nr:hypothetical protein [Chloroflexota bacterium]
EHPSPPRSLRRRPAGRVRGRLPSTTGDQRGRLTSNQPSLHETQCGSLPAADDPGAAGRRLNFEIAAIEATGDWSSRRLEELDRAAIEAFGGIDDDRSLWRVVDLAIVLFRQGRFEESEHYATIAVTRYLDLGADLYALWAIAWLALALVHRGKLEKARDLLLIGISIARRSGSSEGELMMFWAAMPIALDLGLPLLTARLYGALVNGPSSRAGGLDRDARTLADEWLAKASRGQAAVAIQVAIRAGAEAAPIRLVEALPGQLGGSRAPGVAPVPGTVLRHGTITPREFEVLALVGAGRSDQDIAAELFISPKTASVHVSNVKAKLGVQSRLELALRARDLSLVSDAR